MIRDRIAQVPLGLDAGTDAGDEPTLLADLIGLAVRVELDRRVEVGEADDQHAVQTQVERAGAGLEVVVDELLHVVGPVAAFAVGFHLAGRTFER